MPILGSGLIKHGGASTPVSIAATSGTPQSANCGAAFAAPLVATITPALSGVSVTFTAPATGPSGTFASTGTNEETVLTVAGVATSSTFTANATSGAAYNVVASAGALSCNFALTNIDSDTLIASLGAKFWFEADKITGATNNNPLDTWQENSGSGLGDATATTTARPTYLTSLLNGLPIVRFNGTTTKMATGAVAPSAVTGANATTAVFIVKDDPAGGNHILFAWNNDTTNQYAVLASIGSTIYFDHGNNATTGRISVAQPAGWDNNWHIVMVTLGAGVGRIVVDGVELKNAAMSSNITTGTAALILGGYGTTTFLKGDLYLGVGFDRLLTISEQTSLINLLSLKTNIPITPP